MHKSKVACGIMSGTSLDGIDVAIATISGIGLSTKIELVAAKTFPYPKDLLEKVKLATQNELKVKDVSSLNFELGRLYANFVIELCASLKIQTTSLSFIASHGQTVYHQGEASDGYNPSTLQLGSGSVIAGLTKTTVVSDFRVADMIAGGQGAPLVPFVDYILLSKKDQTRIIQNIGGISNITILPSDQIPKNIYAFDTGPGNMMINYAAEKFFNLPYDASGNLASKGHMIQPLFDTIIAHPFLEKLPPKSCGREEFGSAYTEKIIEPYIGFDPLDIIHTITSATAQTMVQSIQKFVLNKHHVDELLISGGGIHNQFIMHYIKKSLPDIKVLTTDEIGISSDFKEAMAFIVLANQTLYKEAANLPSATGAKYPVILGNVSYYK
jgi:anhydro-N-acetylmuramic acid kinase